MIGWDLDSGPPNAKTCAFQMITPPCLVPKSNPQDRDFMFQFKSNWSKQKFIALLKQYKKEIGELFKEV